MTKGVRVFWRYPTQAKTRLEWATQSLLAAVEKGEFCGSHPSPKNGRRMGYPILRCRWSARGWRFGSADGGGFGGRYLVVIAFVLEQALAGDSRRPDGMNPPVIQTPHRQSDFGKAGVA